MAKDPAVLFYTSDFLSGTCGLTMDERGQYITLLCVQHLQGHLSEKTIRLSVGEISEDVRAKFVEDEQGLLFNPRMDEEKAKRAAFVTARVINGKKGGRPSKVKEGENLNETDRFCLAKAKENLAENENINSNNISKDREIVKREREEREAQIEERFNRFWGSYPRKVQKIDARRAFHKLDPEEELLGAIIKAVEASKKSKAWQDEGGAFIPYPATYLNGRRWEDEEPERKAESPRFANYDPEEALRLAIQRSMKG